MKNLLRIAVILLVAIILSSFGISFRSMIINRLYIVICIIFSALLVLTISFNLDKITNKRFLSKCRNKIYYIQKQFIIYFTIATLTICVEDYAFNLSYKLIDILLFYFIINFIHLQKLKDSITDKIIEETSNKEA